MNVMHHDVVVFEVLGHHEVLAAAQSFAKDSGGSITLTLDPVAGVQGAHAVYTDVWVSMGDETSAQERRAALSAYRVDDALLDAAAYAKLAGDA